MKIMTTLADGAFKKPSQTSAPTVGYLLGLPAPGTQRNVDLC
jgi:hypothetical protein